MIFTLSRHLVNMDTRLTIALFVIKVLLLISSLEIAFIQETALIYQESIILESDNVVMNIFLNSTLL